MKTSRTVKAVVFGCVAGALATGVWWAAVASAPRGKPLLIPPRTESDIIVSNVETGVCIFVGVGLPAALIFAFRPRSGKDT